jgi:hypothetical protein
VVAHLEWPDIVLLLKNSDEKSLDYESTGFDFGFLERASWIILTKYW